MSSAIRGLTYLVCSAVQFTTYEQLKKVHRKHITMLTALMDKLTIAVVHWIWSETVGHTYTIVCRRTRRYHLSM